jgi:hypothetical protein
MIAVEVAMTIRRPRHDVAAVMFNPRHDGAWMAGVAQVPPVQYADAHGNAWIRDGTRLEREFRTLTGRRTRHLMVTEFDTDRAMTLVGESPPGFLARYTLEGIPEGTIARIRTELRDGPRWLQWPRAALLRRRIIHDLERLKDLVESNALRGSDRWRQAA